MWKAYTEKRADLFTPILVVLRTLSGYRSWVSVLALPNPLLLSLVVMHSEHSRLQDDMLPPKQEAQRTRLISLAYS